MRLVQAGGQMKRALEAEGELRHYPEASETIRRSWVCLKERMQALYAVG